LAHHGLIKLLVEDALHTYYDLISWEIFRNMSWDYNIRVLAEKVSPSSNEEEEHIEAGEKTGDKETQGKQTQKG